VFVDRADTSRVPGGAYPWTVAGLYDASAEELSALLEGEPAYRTRQVWEGLYRRALLPQDMTDVPVALRSRVHDAFPVGLDATTRLECDGGETVKWLWTLSDGARIETVLMAYPDRMTVCVSTQAGCAMRCDFCATGQAGFSRQLTCGEIVGQVMEACRAASPRRVSNVVFMGMGEPLANFDALMQSVRRLTGDVGMSARHLTVSTVGVVPGIRRLATEGVPVNLAVSLHAARDSLRDQFMPINRRYPLGVLSEACAEYFVRTGRRISFEWALISGVNDTPDDVGELAAYARPLRAHVNLIPLNPTPGYAVRGSSPARVRMFCRELQAEGVNVTVRDTRGRDIDAACGQLAAGAEVGAGRGAAGRRRIGLRT
jgi:23S rRNA (adenine2503-C2)-methyltransferase